MYDLQIGLIDNVLICHLSLFRRNREFYGPRRSRKQSRDGYGLCVDPQKQTDSLDVNAEAGCLLTMKYAFSNNKGSVDKIFLCFAAASEYAVQHSGVRIIAVDSCPQANRNEILLGWNSSGRDALDRSSRHTRQMDPSACTPHSGS